MTDISTPTPEQLAKIGKDFDLPNNPEKTAQVMRVFHSNQLARLRKAGKISETQYQAGDRLYRLHFLGGISGQRGNYQLQEQVDGGGGGLSASDSKIYNEQLYREAIRVIEPRLMSIVHVMVLDMDHSNLATLGREAFGKASDPVARATGMAGLICALDTLVSHFGMVATGREGRIGFSGEKPDHFAVHE